MIVATKKSLGFGCGILSVAIPLVALSAETGGAHQINVIKEIVFPFINFAILLTLLVVLLRRPLKDFLLTRSKKIAQEIEHAAQEKQEAEARAMNYERRLKNIESEMAQLVESFKKEGELARERIIAEANLSAERIQATAELIARQEIVKAKERLKEEAVQLSAEWAERLIRENLKAQDRERMVKDYIKRLEALT